MLRRVKRIKVGKQAYRRLLKRVMDRDGWRCQKCGSLKDLQVHHRQCCSRQGDDSLANLVTLCAYCHKEEHGELSYSQAAASQNSASRRSGIRGIMTGIPKLS
jgi:5-methylcytosine-specific restriction endonuclease McrA